MDDRSLIRNFYRKWNNLPIEIRKEETKNKFMEKLSSEMVKLLNVFQLIDKYEALGIFSTEV